MKERIFKWWGRLFLWHITHMASVYLDYRYLTAMKNKDNAVASACWIARKDIEGQRMLQKLLKQVRKMEKQQSNDHGKNKKTR